MTNLDRAYRVWINHVMLPQTPSKITISNSNKNETITLANGKPFTLPKFDGPQKIEFEFEITNKAYPFTFKDELQGIRFYTDLVWQLKENREPFPLHIVRSHKGSGKPDTLINVILDDYEYVEDAENGNDYIFKVSFTEYSGQNNQELDTEINHHLITAKKARAWIGEVNQQELEEEARIAAEKQAEEDEKNQRKEERKQEAEERKESEESEEGSEEGTE